MAGQIQTCAISPRGCSSVVFVRAAALALSVSMALALPAAADVIAYWHFNDSDVIVDQGNGTLSTNFPAVDVSYTAGTTRNALTGVAAGQGLTLRNQANNGTGYLEFAINTQDHTGLVLSLATQKTSTGFTNNQVAYSTNAGVTFTNFGAAYNPPTSYDVLSFDFSAVTELDHNPHAIFRIQFAGATSGTGNNRFDNIQFQGTLDPTATPEPPVWIALCTAAAGWRWLRQGARRACGVWGGCVRIIGAGSVTGQLPPQPR